MDGGILVTWAETLVELLETDENVWSNSFDRDGEITMFTHKDGRKWLVVYDLSTPIVIYRCKLIGRVFK